jgi:hypothetical protein
LESFDEDNAELYGVDTLSARLADLIDVWDEDEERDLFREIRDGSSVVS